jgi:predicted nucleotidyltransferase
MRRCFGAETDVVLFGSRVRDDARGGDIDLLVETDRSSHDWVSKKVSAIAEIQEAIGEQKIDVVVCARGGDDRLVVREALKNGVRL